MLLTFVRVNELEQFICSLNQRLLPPPDDDDLLPEELLEERLTDPEDLDDPDDLTLDPDEREELPDDL